MTTHDRPMDDVRADDPNAPDAWSGQAGTSQASPSAAQTDPGITQRRTGEDDQSWAAPGGAGSFGDRSQRGALADAGPTEPSSRQPEPGSAAPAFSDTTVTGDRPGAGDQTGRGSGAQHSDGRQAPTGTTPSNGTAASSAQTDDMSLFADNDRVGFRTRWDDVQAAFVDDPRDCVQKADTLVSEVVDRLTDGFSDMRSRLEAQWSRGEEASTEDLRLALKRYREFFQRLLEV
jgi:hypothetical protein